MAELNGYVGVGGAWKTISKRHIGVGGIWKPQLFKWVGKDGKWRLIYNDNPPASTDQFIAHTLNGWTVNPSNLIEVTGERLADVKYPYPKTGGFFDFESNFADTFENFSSSIAVDGITFASIGGETAVRPTTSTQYVKTDNTASGITALGVLGASGNKNYGMSIWAYIATADMPGAGEKRWLWFGGTASAYFGAYVGDDSKVHWIHYDGTNTAEAVSTSLFAADTWNKVIANRDGADYTLSKLYINGTHEATMPSAVNPVTTTEPILITAGLANLVSVNMYAKNFYYLNDYITNDNITVLTQKPTLDIVLKNKSTLVETVISNSWKTEETNPLLSFTIPPSTAEGYYDLILKSDYLSSESLPLPIKVEAFAKSGAFVEDFSDIEAFYDRWNFLKRQWGGANGGVVPELASIKNGELIIKAHGDNYTGDVQGVDKDGNPKTHTHANDPKLGQPWITRVGCALVSKGNYGYGSYKFLAKVPPLTGVASAFWTFHYEEIYPADPRYADFQAEGLHEQGNDVDGYYITRNHEIDIELPSNLDGQALNNVSLLNAKYNTWRGELKNWDVPTDDPDYWIEYEDNLVNHGVDVANGKWHEYRFDWHSDRVEFYMDGVHQVTQMDTVDGDVIPDIPGKITVGLWFPSSNANSDNYPTWNTDSPWLPNPDLAWAGDTADWEVQEMRVRRIEFTPYSEVGERLIGETYPFDGNRGATGMI